MGRCEKCDKKSGNNSKRSCKSQNKVKENNANNAQIINVDVIPDSSQVQSATNANSQNNLANAGSFVNAPTDNIFPQSGASAQASSTYVPLQHAAAGGVMGGLTAEEVKNLLKGATDFATEAANQSSNDDNDDSDGGHRSSRHSQSGCNCKGKHKDSVSAKSKSKKVKKQRAKNNKVNVNLALILTRSSQTPTLAAAQSADNFNNQAPVNAPSEIVPIPL